MDGDATVIELLDRLEDVKHRAAEAVEGGDGDGVAASSYFQQGIKTGTGLEFATDFVFVNLVVRNSDLVQRFGLSLVRLLQTRYPPVAEGVVFVGRLDGVASLRHPLSVSLLSL